MMLGDEWKNWSGSLSFRPAETVTPESEEEVGFIVENAARVEKNVRVVGAGHSSSSLVETKDLLLSLHHFKGVESPDLNRNQATVLGGSTVHEAGSLLHDYGLAMHNTGDVDVQTVAGAIGTGTHGTGRELQNLSAMLIGVRMITGTGELVVIDDKELLQALRVSLGSCGIFLNMRLQLQPTYRLFRKEWFVTIDRCLEDLEKLQQDNRNFDFYWYPRSDAAKIRIMNQSSDLMPEIKYGKLHRENNGSSHAILPRERSLKFDEIEYAFPAESGPACFMEVRGLIKAKFRKEVAWRVLYRTVKADDAFLSPAYGRDTVTISLHHNAGLPYEEYFNAVESIFRKYNGRPHWGKKHSLTAKELQELYPEWNKFQRIRENFDPEGVFLSPYMKDLLINEQ